MWAGLPLLLFASLAYGAEGNELHAIGAVQKGMAGAGVATPADATWTLLNPAGLASLERRVDLIHEFLFIRMESHPRGFPLAANPFAGEMHDAGLILIPAFALAWPRERGTLGFGIFGMSGNDINMPHPRTLLSLGQNADRRSSYEVVRIPLAFAWPVTERLALGAAIVPVATRFRTDSITLKLRPARGRNHWDVAMGIGVEAAIHYQAPAWSLGLTYTSPTWMQEYDLYEKDAMTFSVNLPQKVQAGVGFRPARRWEIALDYKWIQWEQTNLWGRVSRHGGLGWQDQHIFKGAITYEATDRLALRAGISHGNSPLPEESVFVNALSPGVARTHLGAGLSYAVGNQATLHFSLAHALHETLEDNGQGDIFSQLGRGTKVGYTETAVTLQYSLTF